MLTDIEKKKLRQYFCERHNYFITPERLEEYEAIDDAAAQKLISEQKAIELEKLNLMKSDIESKITEVESL